MGSHFIYAVFGGANIPVADKLKEALDKHGTLTKLKDVVYDLIPQVTDVFNEVLDDLIPKKEGEEGEKKFSLQEALVLFQDKLDLQQDQLKNVNVILKELARRQSMIKETRPDEPGTGTELDTGSSDPE